MAMVGEVKLFSPAVAEPPPNAELGGVSFVVEVTQSGGLPVAGTFAVVQPAGSAGAVTESKFSVNVAGELANTPNVKVAVKLPRSIAPSCMWNVSVIVAPHERLFEKLKLRDAVAPAPTAP